MFYSSVTFVFLRYQNIRHAAPAISLPSLADIPPSNWLALALIQSVRQRKSTNGFTLSDWFDYTTHANRSRTMTMRVALYIRHMRCQTCQPLWLWRIGQRTYCLEGERVSGSAIGTDLGTGCLYDKKSSKAIRWSLIRSSSFYSHTGNTGKWEKCKNITFMYTVWTGL